MPLCFVHVFFLRLLPIKLYIATHCKTLQRLTLVFETTFTFLITLLINISHIVFASCECLNVISVFKQFHCSTFLQNLPVNTLSHKLKFSATLQLRVFEFFCSVALPPLVQKTWFRLRLTRSV